MDSLTHIALGACMGEAFAGRTVGRKALLWGALAQSIPDIDFIGAFWQDSSTHLMGHRGFTHSILFALLMTVLLAALAEKWHRPHNISLGRWIAFFAAAILGHLFLDAFNTYGVGWFEPFSHYRISFNIMYVADPFFSIAPGIALLFLMLLKKFSFKRRFWWKFGLGISMLYLCYSVVNKAIINQSIKKILSKQHIPYDRFFTTPAPLQNWLWFVVAGTDSGYYVGYRSIFDKEDTMPFRYFARNSYLLDSLSGSKEVKQLVRFSQGYYVAEKRQDTLLFNDLRFGQIIGWEDPRAGFAFYYYLQPRIDNTLAVQRGRFAKWNWKVAGNFLRRIRGQP